MQTKRYTYPRRARIFMDAAPFINNATLLALDTGDNYLYTTQAAVTSKNGDTFTASFALAAGNYTLNALGIAAANRPKLDLFIDGIYQGTQDWYSGVTTFNVVKTTTVVIRNAGVHYLQGTVNGRNPSSSNWFITLTKIWLVPAAD